MTATDELRRLLNERGVEWTAPNSILRDDMTSWEAGGFYYEAFEIPEPDGTFLLTAAHQDDLTPEQAVEATLGRGECKADKIGDGYLYYTGYWCRGCDERFAYRPIGGKDRGVPPKFCPNCGRRVEVTDG
jgi:hypothetical protein